MEGDKACLAWVHHGVETTKPIPEPCNEIEPGVQIGVSPNYTLFRLELLIYLAVV